MEGGKRRWQGEYVSGMRKKMDNRKGRKKWKGEGGWMSSIGNRKKEEVEGVKRIRKWIKGE